MDTVDTDRTTEELETDSPLCLDHHSVGESLYYELTGIRCMDGLRV